MSDPISVSLSNAILFVSDPKWYSKENYRPMPEPSRSDVVTADEFGMTICCRHEVDGPVAISIGPNEPQDFGMELQIESRLQTPSGVVAASTVYDDAVVETVCQVPESLVRIWLNQSVNADRVHIQVLGVQAI